MNEIHVGILGATGTVGQKFIQLLSGHPFFRVSVLGASKRSAGLPYSKAVRWKQSTPIPETVKDIVVSECIPDLFKHCSLVFSGLDADVAGEIESAFCASDLPIFSNSKNHRRDPTIPLVVPHINPSHLSIIPHQRSLHSPPLKRGCIVTNANCSVTVLAIPLCALELAFGPIDAVLVTTMQAISGAGYPGVPSLDIFDNVVPYIGGEEEKMEWEARKILGTLENHADGFQLHPTLRVSASCNRVPVLEGHTECVSVRFSRRPPPDIPSVLNALKSYKSPASHLASSPQHPILLFEDDGSGNGDRPQPRLDRDFERGAGVCVGRVRECPVLDVKFVVMGNNVSIGAAMSSILNAEWAFREGIIQV